MRAGPRLITLLFHDVYARDPRESGFLSQAADRYKLSIAEFETQLAGIKQERDDAPIVGAGIFRLKAEATLNSCCGFRLQPEDPRFAITVDDGGVSYYTIVADRLEALGWRGHCFVTTDCVGRQGFVTAAHIRELAARGHTIGSHTASHPYRFSSCSPEHMRREWRDSIRALEDIVGDRVTSASVPGGFFSREVAAAAAESGIAMLFTSEPVTHLWSADTCTVAGRFSLRAGCSRNASAKLVRQSPWARRGEWASWNAKGLLKPFLGDSYVRVADWVSARKASLS